MLLREGLISLLEAHGFEVAGQAGNDSELLALPREDRPDVIVVDIRMPPTHTTEGLDTLQVQRRDHGRGPSGAAERRPPCKRRGLFQRR